MSGFRRRLRLDAQMVPSRSYSSVFVVLALKPLQAIIEGQLNAGLFRRARVSFQSLASCPLEARPFIPNKASRSL